MDKNVLAFIEKLELFKTKIKALHWDANSLSQHELCDDIADRIAEFQDQVSEVEQSISGKLPKEMFKPSNQEYGEVGTLKEFVENVIEHTNTFYKKLESKGDKYIGMRSDCESFLSDMQRKLYLVNFTLKEELKKRLRDKINEGYRKEENIRTVFPGTKPSSDGGILKRLDAISSGKNGQFNSRTFDSMEDAFDFFKRNLEKVGDLAYGGNVGDVTIVNLNAENGKSYNGMIDFVELDNGKYKASIKFSNLGKESEFNEDFENNDLRMENKQNRLTEDDFMRRWFDKNEEDHLNKVRKGLNDNLYKSGIEHLKKMTPNFSSFNRVEESNEIKLTESELKQVIKEAAMKILSETPLNYDIDNFSGRWTKSEPSDEEWALADSRANGDYLDDPFHAPNSWDDDEWIDGDKDMENDYSWNLYHRMNNVGKSPVDRQHDVMDAAQNRRDHAAYWTDRDNERGNRLMSKWVDGKRDLDDLEDADFSYDPYKYNESKNPMKVTEAELKQVVKEAAIKLIKEKIEIDPKNKGKFTATKKATGKSTEELTHSKNSLTRKRANFAKMAKRGWKPLKESEYMDDGNLESQYGKNPDSMWTYGTNLNPSVVDGLEPNQVRHAGNGNIKNDNNASWDYFDAVSNGADMKMRNRLDADYRERTNNSPFNGIRKRMDMTMAFPSQTPNERFKQDLDKQWKGTQDVEKYSRQADSRPLHRKGSLNRA